MYPVLQRELLVNLRTPRAFVLLLVYQMILAALVYFAWPQDQRLDLTTNPAAARNLVDLFFFGQYLLASLMAPSFAAGAITGEKERLTYEMLLASPLQPGAIVLGKLAASLAHLAVLIFTSLPIVMLCLPLGGVSLYELLAAYLGLIVSVLTFGAISIACSSYFKRTSASLVVSYLLILPLGHDRHPGLVLVDGPGPAPLAADGHAGPGDRGWRCALPCWPTPAPGCCGHRTSAARAAKWSTWKKRPKRRWGW
jgi:ABC-type transport system involved in multi-copper enzyme maturation permease subunit